jgi:uncharacterized protein (UPF0333 family)
MKYNNKPGIASIPTVLVLLALIVSAVIVISSISISDNLSVAQSNNSDKALNYAQLGAKDALERIVRNKDYTGSYNLELVTNGCLDPYNGCVSVTVNSDSNPKIINSVGQKGEIKRKIQVNVNLDDNGLITNYTWQEL